MSIFFYEAKTKLKESFQRTLKKANKKTSSYNWIPRPTYMNKMILFNTFIGWCHRIRLFEYVRFLWSKSKTEVKISTHTKRLKKKKPSFLDGAPNRHWWIRWFYIMPSLGNIYSEINTVTLWESKDAEL